ncbi:hypothetical protein OWV82_011968 [Melia azedarach]|uniref:Uncharacterized protein n=1 Tax=Melia azedarach TaxID=155640 RepID=A0ACC1Y1F3_MELAZ|nr:hypothetical protein OWV82_011968 [Melia azedarach]
MINLRGSHVTLLNLVKIDKVVSEIGYEDPEYKITRLFHEVKDIIVKNSCSQGKDIQVFVILPWTKNKEKKLIAKDSDLYWVFEEFFVHSLPVIEFEVNNGLGYEFQSCKENAGTILGHKSIEEEGSDYVGTSDNDEIDDTDESVVASDVEKSENSVNAVVTTGSGEFRDVVRMGILRGTHLMERMGFHNCMDSLLIMSGNQIPMVLLV